MFGKRLQDLVQQVVFVCAVIYGLAVPNIDTWSRSHIPDSLAWKEPTQNDTLNYFLHESTGYGLEHCSLGEMDRPDHQYSGSWNSKIGEPHIFTYSLQTQSINSGSQKPGMKSWVPRIYVICTRALESKPYAQGAAVP